MKTLLIILLLITGLAQADYRNQAESFTNTTLPGYDAETNPNRAGIVSVSLDLNTANFWLGDPTENPTLPHEVLMVQINHFCWPMFDGTFRRRSFQYVNESYIVDVVLNEDNSLWVYLDDVRIDEDRVLEFCEDE